MKPIHPILVIAGFAALGTCANPVFAGTGCQDDPEHCIERGVSTSHRSVAVAQAPAPTLASAPGRATAVVATRRAPVPRKPASKPSRVAPSTPAPATPGMGMLLKLSNGGGGDVSLFPSRPSDNTGASWVL